MSNELGDIIITEHRNELGAIERIDCKWTGGDNVQIEPRLMKDVGREGVGKFFNIGPYKLYAYDYDFLRDCFYARRVRGLFWWLPVLWHKTNKLLEIAYRRFIITLAVWGLASYQNYRIPYVDDIYFVRWVKGIKSSKMVKYG